jgi:rhodanese-related sulfurtransferase
MEHENENKKSVIIDVREKHEFQNKLIFENSINIPLTEIYDNLDFLFEYDVVYLCCATRKRAEFAKQLLEDEGHYEVYVLY